MATWIMSTGSSGRDYTEYFLRYGMAFVGGPSPRASMKQVALGDSVLLKRGLTQFVAAGTVVQRNGVHLGDENKEWVRDFDGWDLSAYCYVDWHVPARPEPATGLRIGTIYQTSQTQHLAAVQSILAQPSHVFQDEPAQTKSVTDDDILGS